MEEKISGSNNPKYIWAILAAFAVLIFAVCIYFIGKKVAPPNQVSETPAAGIQREKVSGIKKFASEQEFQDYLEKAKNISGNLGGRGIGGGPVSLGTKDTLQAPADASANATPTRVSETNVQVAGIDEPDAVKTDGKEIYFSVLRPEIMPLDDTVGRPDESKALFPLQQTGGTKTIKAFPPTDLKVNSKIDKSGDLLLVGPPNGEVKNTLVVIPSQRYYWAQNANKIYGFDVSNPEQPKEIWNIEIKDSSSIAAARLYQGKIYLALKTDFTDNQPCLMEPLMVQGSPYTVKCTDIFHPANIVPAEATYTAMAIDPISGKIEKSVSFVGSSDYTTSPVYMSADAIYLTYYNPGDFVKNLSSFFSENKDLVPDWLVQKLKNLEGYDISSSAKMTEVWDLLGRYQNSLSTDDRLKAQNEISNRAADYLHARRRSLDSTGIVKIKAGDFSISAIGTVPGKLLSQFSLDEYQGDLRLATTVGESFLGMGFGFGGASSSDTANDVYILGDDLKTEGSVIDLGKGERIYAVRFLEGKGYVVTFKQVDPLYVLDLTDPINPAKAGELKIPGYSSYLHPLEKNKILGIGEENSPRFGEAGNQVKVSLFDVSNGDAPQEISKYNLSEYYSQVSQTHHAFLLDPQHQIFFLPGSKGGYIFSYAGDNLKLEKTVADISAERAIYINDYLYIIGQDKIVVLDENNWERVGELEL